MESKHYDIIVVGSGDVGKGIAYAAAGKRKKVAMIDKKEGGYDPEKFLIAGAETADRIRRMNNAGIRFGSGQVSWKELIAWKRTHQEKVLNANAETYRQRNIDMYQGTVRFIDETSIVVGEALLSASLFAIATGSVPQHLGVKGEEYVVDSAHFLDMEHLPKRIIFIGGGHISFECAHIAARAGAEVMIISRHARVLTKYDAGLVSHLVSTSTDLGIIIKTGQPLVKIEKQGSSFVVFTQEQGREVRENADLVVHGGGRVAAVDGLDLEKAHVSYSEKGITVNRYLQSVSNPRIYAAGDVAHTGAMLVSVGILEGKLAVYNMLHKTRRRYPDYSSVPSVVRTIPPLAQVGLTEEQASAKRLQFDIRMGDMHEWLHNLAVNQPAAHYKVLVQKRTNRIVGAHILGEHADEIINLFAYAMQHKMTTDDIEKVIFAYPTALASVHCML